MSPGRLLVLTNIDIDEKLLSEARRVTGLKTKRAIVEAGLQALIKLHGQADVRQLWGRLHGEESFSASAAVAPPEAETVKGRKGRADRR
jgi:Arc/MetJ family transcription regulator